jgi:hypothetical protein
MREGKHELTVAAEPRPMPVSADPVRRELAIVNLMIRRS